MYGLAFVADITNHLNAFNLSLLSKGHSRLHLVGYVEGFHSKIVLF